METELCVYHRNIPVRASLNHSVSRCEREFSFQRQVTELQDPNEQNYEEYGDLEMCDNI